MRPSVSQDEALAKALAQGGHNLQVLCAPFLVDAAAFFPNFRNPIDWNFPYFARLTILSLTAQCLSPHASSQSINTLLSSVCNAIYQMPMLETMQIWNAGRSYASYFTFWRPGPSMREKKALHSWHGEKPFVKFKSTWRLNLRAAVAYWAGARPRSLSARPTAAQGQSSHPMLYYRPSGLTSTTLDAPSTVDDTCNHLWPYLFLHEQMLSPPSRGGDKDRISGRCCVN